MSHSNALIFKSLQEFGLLLPFPKDELYGRFIGKLFPLDHFHSLKAARDGRCYSGLMQHHPGGYIESRWTCLIKFDEMLLIWRRVMMYHGYNREKQSIGVFKKISFCAQMKSLPLSAFSYSSSCFFFLIISATSCGSAWSRSFCMTFFISYPSSAISFPKASPEILWSRMTFSTASIRAPFAMPLRISGIAAFTKEPFWYSMNSSVRLFSRSTNSTPSLLRETTVSSRVVATSMGSAPLSTRTSKRWRFLDFSILAPISLLRSFPSRALF